MQCNNPKETALHLRFSVLGESSQKCRRIFFVLQKLCFTEAQGYVTCTSCLMAELRQDSVSIPAGYDCNTRVQEELIDELVQCTPLQCDSREKLSFLSLRKQ